MNILIIQIKYIIILMNSCCCLNPSKKVIPEAEINNVISTKNLNIKINQSVLNQFNDYNFIGDGYSSKVYKCFINKKKYACKSIYKQYTREALTEINILKKFDSFLFLPKIYDWNENIDKYFILMEYVKGRELFYLLDENISLKLILNITYQILLAIAELQSHCVFHLDLKLENIIMSNAGRIKIIDFGLSEEYNSRKNYVILSGMCGTLGYYSPEMLLTSSATDKTDLWNLGIIFWMLLAKFPPFTICPQESYSCEIKNLNIFSPLQRYNLEEHNDELKELESDKIDLYRDFLSKTITTLSNRKNVFVLLNHSLFNKIKNNY